MIEEPKLPNFKTDKSILENRGSKPK